MKRAIITAVAAIAATMGLHGQSKITNELLQYNDTKAIVTFDLQTQENNIPSNRKEVIKPFLFNGPDTLWLDKVEVYGKNRLKREIQENRLSGVKDWELTENQMVKGITYNYSAETKVKRWMTPAYLGIKREIRGCGCEDEMMFADQLVTHSTLYHEPPAIKRRHLTSYALEDAQVKMELEQDNYEIIFKVAKTRIDSTIFNNGVAFGNILAAVDKIYSRKGFKIDKIEIAGFASPEGTQSFNRWLGENRAKALIKYIIENRPQYNLTPDNFIVINGEENWAGLRKMTLSSQMSQEEKQKIIDIIDSPAGAARKGKLKALDGGRTYLKMLKEVYPHLRSATYVSLYYGTEDEQVVEKINLANSQIEKGEYAKALETITPYSEDFRAYNTYAVALMMNGEFEKALPYLDKAIDEGCHKAFYNKSVIEAELEWEATKRKEREEYIKRFE